MADHLVRAFSGQEAYTDLQLQEALIRLVRVYIKIGNKKFGCNLPMPEITFDLCDTNPTWAGAACADHRLEINMVLFRDNVDHILNQTGQHEVAHLFQFHLFDRKGVKTQGHGAEWQEIMKQLGKDPFKYHTLDITKAKQHHREKKKAKKKAEKDALKALQGDNA